MTSKLRVLMSVYDKTGLVPFAQGLIDLGAELVSSGGTATALAEAGIPHWTVESVTGSPEMLGGRVKTLHPQIHGGILADLDKPEHVADLRAQGMEPFKLVVCNLYPFTDTVASGASYAECIEKIDVGGPTMVRAAAKNWAHVGSIVDPADYGPVLAELREHGKLSDKTRRRLAGKAFAHTAAYDLAIVEWLSDGDFVGMLGKKEEGCDYGENRWQSPAALYRFTDDHDPLSLAAFDVVAGRDPSYINWSDMDRLLQTTTHLVAEHRYNCGHDCYIAVAVKHGNPCGAAAVGTPEAALQLMLMGDPRAVFGGIIMVNFPITGELAETLLRYGTDVRRLLDGICAPAFDEEALSMLGRKDGKYFLAVNPALASLEHGALDTRPLLRQVRGGFLRQPNYTQIVKLYGADGAEVLSEAERCDLSTALAICATSNSNTVTAVRDGQLIANGVGQQDRVGCCELAIVKARQNGHAFEEGIPLEGAVVASDSFFPFPDGPQMLIDAGVRVIFAPTGSNNDSKVQEVCSQQAVPLVQRPDADARMFYRH